MDKTIRIAKKDSWEAGYGVGVTGPTTPVSRPTVLESTEYDKWENLNKEGPRPPCRHTVIRDGFTTVAIIPLPKDKEWEGWFTAVLMSKSRALLGLVEEVYHVVTNERALLAADWKDRAEALLKRIGRM